MTTNIQVAVSAMFCNKCRIILQLKTVPQQIKYLVLFIVLITFRKAAQVFEENWEKKLANLLNKHFGFECQSDEV